MNKALAIFTFFLFTCITVYSQVEPDTTIPKKDSPRVIRQAEGDSQAVTIPKKSVKAVPVKSVNPLPSGIDTVNIDTLKDIPQMAPVTNAGLADSIPDLRELLNTHPFFNFSGKAEKRRELKRKEQDADLFFYIILGLFFYFGLVKTVFSKYVNNLFAIFLRITLKQQQLREQLLQAPLPSILLNFLFLLSGGFYASLLLEYYQVNAINDFWLQTAYCILLLGIIYSGKLIFLKSMGWVFNIRKTTDTYIFIVFLVNKMLGILLLPFLVFIVFEPPPAKQVFVTLSLILLIILVFYRFVFSFRPLRNEIKIHLIHFFLYLCAFEIAPLLLIYKVLLTIVEKSN